MNCSVNSIPLKYGRLHAEDTVHVSYAAHVSYNYCTKKLLVLDCGICAPKSILLRRLAGHRTPRMADMFFTTFMDLSQDPSDSYAHLKDRYSFLSTGKQY